ncbi:MAG TPA: DUF523 and DUF1722 domain-containing protein [Syntrophorhabdaceae bacterium]|nr:DUF523 and DUF1722 domain-containing protein [Syntrophorhabdaceae bacterium]HQM80174.1 DUF523 and DUF1722 domain-containing protein [Syntrophorhabdaceae bacterium]
MEKITIGISTCLLGEKVRYDGGHKHDRYITGTLGQYFEWAPVCPEVGCGLPVPREAMRLVGSPEDPRLITIRTGIDHTERMKEWAQKKLDDLAREELSGFIFKSRSPSSGMQGVKVYSESGMPSRRGAGIFARAFMERFPLLPAEDDGRLNDPKLRENFIERVFVFKRWQELLKKGGAPRDLVNFHTDHKLLLMAHSPQHASILGKIVATPGKSDSKLEAYIRTMMEGLRLIATSRKNTNVLDHIMGYFKKQLTGDEKQELLEIIGNYHKGVLPLIVPITVLNHYVRKYDEPYLKRQYYLNPHPVELMLRNHV